MSIPITADHLERLKAMAVPDQQTWDLSPKNVAAISWAVETIEANQQGQSTWPSATVTTIPIRLHDIDGDENLY